MAQPLAFRADRAVASVLAESEDDDLLYPQVLDAMGRALTCGFGAVWEVDADRHELACVATWSAPGVDAGGFTATTTTSRFEAGSGLPGRVWMTGRPEWIVDLQDDRNFPRAPMASAAGLTSAFCFPLRSASGVLGVIELYTEEPRIPDRELLDDMASLGAQLGQFVARRRAERSVRESEARKRAILAAALDCVVTIDHAGRIIEFNKAAEETFGYSSADAIGREMVELIVPPSLRARHRAGFARYLETGNGTIIGRRVEITGRRADGSEFPVELAIMRIALPGPPMFTGYLRDITERKQAEADLRASRARIVAAADAERRRLERDLHDGAQQRLVNLALLLQLARARADGEPERALAVLDDAIAELSDATEELRELARGIHPAVLTDGGLAPALVALADRSNPRARLVAAPRERLPCDVEATAYFVVAEALTNAARHASATNIAIEAQLNDADLVVEVRDNGSGGAAVSAGSGLGGLQDRVAALGGSLAITSPRGEGTTIRAVIPCE